MSKCIVILLESPINDSPDSLNSLVSNGWSGRLILKKAQSPLDALMAKYPSPSSIIENDAENFAQAIEESPNKLVIIRGSQLDGRVSSLLNEIVNTYYVIVIAHPYPLPHLDNSHPMAFCRPKQSYLFQNCDDITDQIDFDNCCVYAEYCPGYTRRDNINSFQDAVNSLGAAHCILAEHLSLEIAYCQGIAPKYGA